ncbi:cupin domain-containing protein [Dongia sp.]|uniref:cupin domain-containing protein n=1 Tax=Dongia sp. TaxID=1977262 RepID=UPI0035B0B2B1
MHAATDDLVTALQLQPHPEGGFYRETYRATEAIPNAGLPARFHGDRAHSTAIYYLLRAGERSKLHRIKSDEVWHFYEGDALTIIALSPGGQLIETTLGRDFARGQVPQHVVPAGFWFGALPAKGSAFTLAGCTVAPGFDFADFDLGERSKLLHEFPQHRAWIERLTD